MAEKLTGMLNLSAIPKECITTTQKGNKVIYVDIVPRKDGADSYGNTHYIQLYNKETKQKVYFGNFKPIEFGEKTNYPTKAEKEEDLPF